jgi:hypothetical protein
VHFLASREVEVKERKIKNNKSGVEREEGKIEKLKSQ